MNVKINQYCLLMLLAATGMIFSGRLQSHEFLTGYKVVVQTRIYEDGSLSVRYDLNLDPDAAETIAHKRQIFLRNSYELTEQKKENAYLITAVKHFSPAGKLSSWSDELSERRVMSRRDTFYYHETFLNFLIRDELSGSNLNRDTATAKVLMADTDYLFKMIFPGRILEAATGQVLNDTVQWQYDVEQLFHKKEFVMEASSVIDRDEDVSGVLMMIAVLVLAISVLLWYRNKSLSRAGEDS